MGYSSKDLKRMGFDDIVPIKKTKMGNKHTWYKGILFRSQLEAKFACMMDYYIDFGLVTSWEFEPETLVFEDTDSHGKRRDVEYIYDFYVEGYEGSNWVVECKGQMSNYDILKWELFKREDYEEKLMIVFAQNLFPKKLNLMMGQRKNPLDRRNFMQKGKVSRNMYDRMHRTVDRVWENVNREFQEKWNMTIVEQKEGHPILYKG